MGFIRYLSIGLAVQNAAVALYIPGPQSQCGGPGYTRRSDESITTLFDHSNGTTSVNDIQLVTSVMDPKEHSPREYWDTYHTCPPAYFARTQQNIDESGSDEWYIKYTSAARSNHSNLDGPYREVDSFAKKALHETDFNCDVRIGCSGVPSCNTIVKTTESHNKHLSPTEQLDLARKIYFSLKKIEAMNQELSLMWGLMHDAEVNVGFQIEKVILDFTRQDDGLAMAQCQALTFIMRFLWSSAMVVMSSALVVDPIEDCPLCGMVTMFIGHIKDGVEGVQSLSDTMNAMIKAGEISELGLQNKGFHLPSNYATGMCASYGDIAGASSQNGLRSAELKSHIQSAFNGYKYAIEKYMDALNDGVVDGSKKFISMAHLMPAINLPSLEPEVHKSITSYEMTLTNTFTQFVISMALSSSKSYLKCKTNIDDVESYRPNSTDFKGLRFIPKDDPNTVCQMQSWTSQSSYNHEREMYGIHALQNYGISPLQMMEESYRHHKESDEPNAPPLLSIDKGSLTLDNGLALPVCHSEYVKITEFHDSYDNKWDDEMFPCSCGDWRSSETRSFMDALGMGWSSSALNADEVWETMMQVCPLNLDRLPPLNRILAYYGLGIIWPSRGYSMRIDHDHVHYGAIYNKVRQAPEGGANWAFCTQHWNETESLFENDVSYLDNVTPQPQSTYYQCQSWLKAEANHLNEYKKQWNKWLQTDVGKNMEDWWRKERLVWTRVDGPVDWASRPDLQKKEGSVVEALYGQTIPQGIDAVPPTWDEKGNLIPPKLPE